MEIHNYNDNNSDWVFNFETDHLALRGNVEYSRILRTIALLEAQKIQIHSEVESIILSKNKYLEDPSSFVKDIFENRLVSPKYICIPSIPDIGHNHAEVSDKNEAETKINLNIKVRGRIFDQSKPETFNQLWTCEEQRRLEQLLIEYPVEPVEMRRFTKIALALGNRTPQQVASRVQKFFKKLQSVGMPVPGRIPKNKRTMLTKSRHFYKNFYRRSTFFPAHNVPVNIPDDDISNIDPYANNSLSDYKTIFATFTEQESLSFKKFFLHMLQVTRSGKLCTGRQCTNFDKRCNICIEPSVREYPCTCSTCSCDVNLCGDCIIQQILDGTFAHQNHDVMVNKGD